MNSIMLRKKFFLGDQLSQQELVLLFVFAEDSNMERQQAVSMKISKYLLKADDLYQNHLVSGGGEQVTWNRWGVSGFSVFAVVLLLKILGLL